MKREWLLRLLAVGCGLYVGSSFGWHWPVVPALALATVWLFRSDMGRNFLSLPIVQKTEPEPPEPEPGDPIIEMPGSTSSPRLYVLPRAPDRE